MGSGRILGLAWHLHRSGSSSLFTLLTVLTVPYPLMSTFLTPCSLLLFSTSPFHPWTDSLFSVLRSPFIPLPVFLSSCRSFSYTVLANSNT